MIIHDQFSRDPWLWNGRPPIRVIGHTRACWGEVLNAVERARSVRIDRPLIPSPTCVRQRALGAGSTAGPIGPRRWDPSQNRSPFAGEHASHLVKLCGSWFSSVFFRLAAHTCQDQGTIPMEKSTLALLKGTGAGHSSTLTTHDKRASFASLIYTRYLVIRPRYT